MEYKKTMRPVIGGILLIVGGIISMLFSFILPYFPAICASAYLVGSISGITGGILAIIRRSWGVALVCGIISILSGSWLSIIGVILIGISKSEFGITPEALPPPPTPAPKPTQMSELSQPYKPAIEPTSTYTTPYSTQGTVQEAPEELYNMGIKLARSKRYNEAIGYYDRALALSPKDPGIWCNKGDALMRLRHYEKAIECYDMALAIFPKSVTAWDNKGTSFYNLGRYEEAIECYNKALEINPEYEPARKGIEIARERLR